MSPEAHDDLGALRDAAERVATARASDKYALWIAGVAAALSMLVMGEALGSPWAIIVIATVFGGAYRVAKIALYRARGLGSLPLFGDLLPATVSARSSSAPAASGASNVPQPRSALVPRLSFSRTWPAAWIVTAKIAGVETLRGGRLDTATQDLPLGVLLVTARGLAFLPEARGPLEALIGDIPAGVVTQLAGAVFKPIEHLNRWQDVLEATREPPTLVEWMDTALAQKHAFAISWGDLTGVLVGATHTVLTRETADGTREDVIIMDASPEWPGVLMQQRIVADLEGAVLAKVLQPKYDELLPEVRAARATTSETDVGDETWRRTIAWFSTTKPPLETAVREAMAGALDGYAMLPNVVANQPWLFPSGGPGTPA